MTVRLSRIACWLGLILTWGSAPQVLAADCAWRIAAPKMPPLARQGRPESKTQLKVLVAIRTDGTGEVANASSIPVVFRYSVLDAVGLSRFRADCSGKRLEYFIEFRLYGKATSEHQDGQAVFEPPNRITVIASPSALQP